MLFSNWIKDVISTSEKYINGNGLEIQEISKKLEKCRFLLEEISKEYDAKHLYLGSWRFLDGSKWTGETIEALQNYLIVFHSECSGGISCVDGYYGKATKIALQRVLVDTKSQAFIDYACDGHFGSVSIRACQEYLLRNRVEVAVNYNQRGVFVDGRWGSNSKKALQQLLVEKKMEELNIDGNFSRNSISVRALQKFLQSENTTISVDGHWGGQTTKAFQRFLFDQNTVALNDYCADGDFGGVSIRALQQFLNKNQDSSQLGVDGKWGNQTNRALKAFLNAKLCTYIKTIRENCSQLLNEVIPIICSYL